MTPRFHLLAALILATISLAGLAESRSCGGFDKLSKTDLAKLTEKQQAIAGVLACADRARLPTAEEEELTWYGVEKERRKTVLTQMRAAFATPEGKERLTRLVAATLAEWQKGKNYPPGLTPKDWKPLKKESRDPAGFFATVGATRWLIEVMNNLKGLAASTATGVCFQRNTEALARYENYLATYYAFRLVGEGAAPEEKLGDPNF